jgi:exopolysaccharide biosynthesis polyprenyl glycosylphosphotransferase
MQASQEISKPFPPFKRPIAPPLFPVAPTTTNSLSWPYKLADVLLAIAAVIGAFILTNFSTMPGQAAGFLALRVSVKNLLLIVFFALLWSGICHAFRLYQPGRLQVIPLQSLLFATGCGSSGTLIFVLTSRAGAFKITTVLATWLLSLSLAIAVRLLIRTLTGPASLSSQPLQIIILGSGQRALRLYEELKAKADTGYRVLGFVDNPARNAAANEIRMQLLGDLADLERILVDNLVDEVLITLPVKSCYGQIQKALQVCERVGVEAKYLSEIFEPSFATPEYERLEGFAVTSLKPVVDDTRFVCKRAVDLASAAVGLLLLSPAFLLIAIAIKLTSNGPVIFTQERHGRNRRRFRMYKFRTMIHNAEALQPALESHNEAIGPLFKIRQDPRITRVGAFLRRTSLDELPQLLNVLKGEMSLVGPRPLPVRDVSRFSEGWLLRRFCVVPGLTGLWQVNARATHRFEDWVKQDFHYIDNWTLKLDLLILAKTIPAVWKGSGAV